ncbi:MAG: GDYXXLXY domain-containing protein [Kiritimatiellae bacterium]|nr:GDYXXLXY domain-containing protein [Kiritimatiellia bacterium]MCO5068948.1 GDYXXLXY domain-containing protein [Kiritimatiellia bacterium]
MKKRIAIGVLLVVAAVQLAVPALMVQGRERTLREGEAFRFRTQPVDPYDAFRGRYVALSAEQFTINSDMPMKKRGGRERVYASLTTDADGYGAVSSVSRDAPTTGAYIRATVWSVGDGKVLVRLPLERFYLPEDEAPAAEAAYRTANSRGARAADIVVRVRKGDAVIEDLLIEGTPIRVWLKKEKKEALP